MNRAGLRLPLAFVTSRPWLLVQLGAASLGRAALVATSLLLARAFLARAAGGEALWAAAAFLALTQLGAASLGYLAHAAEQRLAVAIELGVMERLVRQLVGLSVGFLDRRTHGEVLESARRDVANVRVLALAAAGAIIEATQGAAIVAAGTVISPPLALWAFLLVPLAAAPVVVAARRTFARSFGARQQSVAIFNALLQVLQGIRLIKVYGREDAEAGQVLDRTRRYLDDVEAVERARARARASIEAVAALSLFAIVIVGGLRVMDGRDAWPSLLTFVLAARALQGPLHGVSTHLLDIQRHAPSAANLDALLAERSPIADAAGAEPLRSRPTSLSVEGVSLRIGQWRLAPVSFGLTEGETLGVVGPSGAGKTTLLALLARFVDPDEGAVRLDGRDVRRIRIADLHEATAMVTQEPFLFAASIRENIRCARPQAADAEVEAAARSANVHDDIMAMADGYDTRVGCGGRGVSRGEAQRINLARAILKDAPILLLDEPSSSLDQDSEAKVQRVLERLAAGRLSVVVAHRLGTLTRATKILVLDEGRPVGLGTHAQLLIDCPAYARLWHAQEEPLGHVAP